jgi:hypothetical protein
LEGLDHAVSTWEWKTMDSAPKDRPILVIVHRYKEPLAVVVSWDTPEEEGEWLPECADTVHGCYAIFKTSELSFWCDIVFPA